LYVGGFLSIRGGVHEKRKNRLPICVGRLREDVTKCAFTDFAAVALEVPMFWYDSGNLREDAAEMRVPVEYNHRRLGVPPAQIGVQGGGRVFFHTEGHKGHEDTSFEQELTEETEENLTQFLASGCKSFFLCCLPFLLFNQSVFVSFVAFCVKDNWAVHDVGIEVGS
jgi:hypothetical protein